MCGLGFPWFELRGSNISQFIKMASDLEPTEGRNMVFCFFEPLRS